MTNIVFEEKIEEIDAIIASKRGFWQLTSLSYIDYDDISQLIRIHIFEKFHLWKRNLPFPNWVSTVVTNKIKNFIRDHYGKMAPPCNKCPFNNGGSFCQITSSGQKDSSCKPYNKWLKGKKMAYEMKLACSLEDYDGHQTYSKDFDFEKSADKFHCAMQKLLSTRLFEAYRYLYMDGLSDEEVVEKMRFKKTKEKGRLAGYRQLTNIKKEIKSVADELIQNFEVEY